LAALLLVSSWLYVTPTYASPAIEGDAAAKIEATGAKSASEILTWSQIAMALGVLVLVILVLVLIAGFFIHAIDNETPEQKLERELNKEKLKELVKVGGVYYGTTEILKKLK
jgi:hypothetical protein